MTEIDPESNAEIVETAGETAGEDKLAAEAIVEPQILEEGGPEVEVAGESAAEEVQMTVEDTLRAEIAQLEARLSEAESKAAEYLDALQRSQASFANYRKRSEAEQASWRTVANAALLARFLPVMDDFERAFSLLPPEYQGQPWLEGINLIRRKIGSILESENVQPIVVKPGDPFDPMYHQAVFYQEVAGFEEGQIVAEVERGYILKERVLRPSSVVVAKAPAVAPEPETPGGSAAAEPQEPTAAESGCSVTEETDARTNPV